MGDPRKTRKKYSSPSHPWQKDRIVEEAELIKKYALKNKKEIWKMSSILKNFKHQAKRLSSLTSIQADREKMQLIRKMVSMGLLNEGEGIENILILQVESIMERRLATMVFKKGLARSINQARQFITHGHIKVGSKKITCPSYIVLVNEENNIGFRESSSLADPENPERKIIQKADVKPEKEKSKQKKSE